MKFWISHHSGFFGLGFEFELPDAASIGGNVIPDTQIDGLIQTPALICVQIADLNNGPGPRDLLIGGDGYIADLD
jgi:hypothetical protein